MEKYITKIKDLVIQALTNGSDIKENAENGDALSCFQMGMIHLLGINTSIDFIKARSFFENQSLADDPETYRILGFICECEKNYSAAFMNYSKAAGKSSGKEKDTYIHNVIEQRNSLQGFLKKLSLPNSVLNNEISAIFNEYVKGDNCKVDSCLKIAMICDDELTCLEAAQSLFDIGDYNSAKKWLEKGKIAKTNELFVKIEEKQSVSQISLKLPNVLQVIEVKGNSLLRDSNTLSSLVGIKEKCNVASDKCRKIWMKEVPNLIDKIQNRLDEEEKIRIKKEQEEETARLKKLEAEEYLAFLEEQERRRTKIYRRYNIIFAILSSPFNIALIVNLFINQEGGVPGFLGKLLASLLVFAIIILLPYYVIKWIIKKICKL